MIKVTNAEQYGSRWLLTLSSDLPCDVQGYYERRGDGVWTISLEWSARGNSIRLVQLAPDGSAGAYLDIAVGRLNEAVSAVIGPRNP